MNPLIEYKRYNRISRIQPGAVGSVGDVLPVVRLKQSSPDSEMRFTDITSTPGSYCTDLLRVIDNRWQGRQSYKTQIGWKIEDYVESDNYVEPQVGSIGNFSFRNKVANIYESRRTGELFLPLPQGYGLAQGEIARGGSAPRVTDIVGEEVPFESVVYRQQYVPQRYGYSFQKRQ